MKIFSLFGFFILLITLNSCAIHESVVFKSDNSGQIKYKVDLSQMMGLGDALGAKKVESDTDEKKEVSKKIDSVFSMKTMLASKKDSISKLSPEKQAELKKLEKFTIRLAIDEDNKKMEYEMFVDFDNIKEFANLGSPLNALSNLNPTGTELPQEELEKNKSQTNYYFDGKKFSKKVTNSPEYIKELEANRKANLEEETKESDSLGLASKMTESVDMLMSQSTYTMTVTFPKKVKKISVKNATLSEDKKTVTLTYSMDAYMKSTNLDFDVELEK